MGNYKRINSRVVKEHVWWVERDAIGIALYDASKDQKDRFTSVTAVHEITLFYIKKGLHFENLGSATSDIKTEESDLPTQFHQYIVDKAIQYGYEQKPETLKVAMYYDNKFERGIKEGKSFANRGRISGMRTVKQHSY